MQMVIKKMPYILYPNNKKNNKIQGRMMILEFCNFFIWTLSENEGKYQLVFRFINVMMEKLHNYYFTFNLPETMTRENDVYYDNEQKNYCICKRSYFKLMIEIFSLQ